MNVFAVATVLDFQNDPESAEAWKRIEKAFLISDIEKEGLTHFSWHVADSYQSGKIEDRLKETARDLSLISTTSTGLGIFTSEKPVLYLPVMKTKKIADLHRKLWKCLGPIAENPYRYYDPDHWIPHITLAHEDVHPEKIGQMTSLLLRCEMVLRFRIDHLALIFRNGVENGTVLKIPFGRLL
jgi:hypothetical protein